MDAIDVAGLALRAWLGVVMVAHGVNHARSLDGTTRWFASAGFSRPRLVAMGSAIGETTVGVGLVVGLATPVAAAGVVAVAGVAFGAIHRFAGFFVFHRPDEGWEYVATLAMAAAVVASSGGGRVSVDALLRIEDTLSGWTGLALAATGLLAAVVHLAVGWHRPP
jgi:putative oxidoreductase